jgi:hypothetical protein
LLNLLSNKKEGWLNKWFVVAERVLYEVYSYKTLCFLQGIKRIQRIKELKKKRTKE